MACGSCSVGVAKAACNSGSCTGGCSKLNVFNWLADWVEADVKPFSLIEIRFKGTRKEYFKKPAPINLFTGDGVIVDTPIGQDFGFVSLQGPLVRLQMKKIGLATDAELHTILRKATKEDWQQYEEAKNKELPCLYRTRQIIQELGLEMKLSDVEYQWDLKKATFYYSADDRVDFRELIKILASEFKIRVEMKQISLRHEAARLGGIGVCGRELCCSTWLTDFKNVNTAAARYQNLAINSQKLSGQCGRLKCCLNFELDTYVDALKDIPEVKQPIQTLKGNAVLQKTDIFKKVMWFSIGNEADWVMLSVSDVKILLEWNASGKIPPSLDVKELPLVSDAMKKKATISNDTKLKPRNEFHKNRS